MYVRCQSRKVLKLVDRKSKGTEGSEEKAYRTNLVPLRVKRGRQQHVAHGR